MSRSWKAVLAAFLLGALVMSAVPVMAGNGDPLILGEKNTARRVTKVRIKNGAIFEATGAGVPAATFNVASGAPIAVNSAVRVAKLNADEVDGKDAAELIPDWAWLSNDNIPDGVEWSTTTRNITIPPGGGVILMSGSITFYNSGAVPDWVTCFFKAAGTNVNASRMMVYAGPSEWATCSTTAAFAGQAQTYTVQFLTDGMQGVATIHPDKGFWWAHSLGNP